MTWKVRYGHRVKGLVTGWDAVRVLRLVAFAVTATCLALGSHLLAGGMLPAVVPGVLACVLPGVAGALLTRRRRGPVEILVVLSAVQLAMHEVFSTTAAMPGSADPACSMTAMAMTASPGASAGGPAAVGGGVLMVAAHAIAVVITAVVLARGECALDALLTVLARMRRGCRRGLGSLPQLPVLDGPTWSVAAVPQGMRLGLVASAAVARRGPPLPVW
jgi:hypothetical protein